jgi:hypothetical protein
LREIKIFLTLVKVRILRYVLVLRSLLKAVHLRLPLQYSTFSLLPKIEIRHRPLVSQSVNCDSKLRSTVDVIISLYKFDQYKQVLESSLQSCFLNPKITYHFVLVSGSESEIDWLRSITKTSHHKVYLVAKRIGIYSAWNMAVESGSGEFITNLNADDLRMPHSICSQAASLQAESAAGSFGNFILTDDIFSILHSNSESWLASDLGEFNEETLVFHSQNKMHCAPMWRRSIHSTIGLFDDSLVSSGDTDFWLRAMVSKFDFVPYEPVTAVYFHNPEGLSTSVESSGHREWTGIRDRYIRALFASQPRKLCPK